MSRRTALILVTVFCLLMTVTVLRANVGPVTGPITFSSLFRFISGTVDLQPCGSGTTVGFTNCQQSFAKGQAVAPVALTPGTIVSVDASGSNNFTLTPVQNFTLSNPTNLLAGQTLNFWITQDATGSRVLTLGTEYQAAGGSGGLVLSTLGGSKDLLTCVSDTTTTLTCALMKAISH